VQNLLLKTPYKFKKSYGGTPEPQTPQDAPWLRGPSLKILQAAGPGWDGRDHPALNPMKCAPWRHLVAGYGSDALNNSGYGSDALTMVAHVFGAFHTQYTV
jgi:hypothetical protein